MENRGWHLGKKKVITEENLSNMVLPETTDVLGVAMKLLGNDRVQIKCQDGYTRICRIRGKMKKTSLDPNWRYRTC